MTRAVCVEKSYSYTVGPEVVFDALTSEEAAAEWMSGALHIELMVGGAVRVSVDGYPDVTGVVTAFRRDEHLALDWSAEPWPGPLHTEISITPQPGGSVVKVVETGFDGDIVFCGTRDNLWSYWLIRLVALT